VSNRQPSRIARRKLSREARAALIELQKQGLTQHQLVKRLHLTKWMIADLVHDGEFGEKVAQRLEALLLEPKAAASGE
jgi:hypothetical protein